MILKIIIDPAPETRIFRRPRHHGTPAITPPHPATRLFHHTNQNRQLLID